MLVNKSKNKKYGNPTVISLFTCGMGMDRGFELGGFQTVYANDITKFACETIRNVKKEEIGKKTLHLDEGNIFDIPSKKILENIELEKGEPDLIIGGPPCQSFSTAGTRKGLKDERGMAVMEYIKKINEIRPKAFVFENVHGIISMAIDPMSFYDRIEMNDSELRRSQRKGSLFRYIENKFNELKKPKEGIGYTIKHDILNAADFGIPQNRKRFVMIGIRKDVGNAEEVMDRIKSKAKYADPKKISTRKDLQIKAVKYQEIANKALENNKPEKAENYQRKADEYKKKAEKLDKKEWRTLKTLKNKFEGETPEEYVKFSANTMKFLKHIPKKTGGCWIDLPKKLQIEAMGGAADTEDPKRKGKQGGRRGFYRRLSWDKPAPTLVTSPTQTGTCMAHPEYDRPLSVKEYAIIQGFPTNWKFQGSLADRYRMIGEAVPVKLAMIIAETIHEHIT
ncbi:DNA cytosine methyltransferase [Nitrosopumilus sp.]|uniref:DNA cytosine methyltransferase n=1 Tax=Nitrosopumilus sp. TaxID=2024843 RepID=UPI00247D6370|nr:DNA cytosine methyltransferase [Nitrosopumilus sp.]MCV0409368.1 DNA cytosine methyltransferase [Nitrosopumilus sp.]